MQATEPVVQVPQVRYVLRSFTSEMAQGYLNNFRRDLKKLIPNPESTTIVRGDFLGEALGRSWLFSRSQVEGNLSTYLHALESRGFTEPKSRIEACLKNGLLEGLGKLDAVADGFEARRDELGDEVFTSENKTEIVLKYLIEPVKSNFDSANVFSDVFNVAYQFGRITQGDYLPSPNEEDSGVPFMRRFNETLAPKLILKFGTQFF